MIWSFITSLDEKVFRYFNPSYQSTTKNVIVLALIGSVVASIMFYISAFFGLKDSTLNVVSWVLVACLLVFMFWMERFTLQAFGGWGGRIAYAAYIALIGYLAFCLALFVVALFIFLFVLGFFLKLLYWNGGDSSKRTITYSDGTQEEAEVCGRGALGETFVRTKDGKEHMI